MKTSNSISPLLQELLETISDLAEASAHTDDCSEMTNALRQALSVLQQAQASINRPQNQEGTWHIRLIRPAIETAA
jgi:hypothetical protein|tara:strand:- start:384 stop:611 length:228 start_codon:yes stop_codon:yes gene_type:complete